MEPHPKKKARREARKKVIDAISQAIRDKDKEGKPRYYYIRENDTKRPIVTVCEIGYEGKIYRGLSICSFLDNPRKSTGRRIAFDRAVAAIIAGKELFPVKRDDAFTELQCAGVVLSNTEEEFCKAQVSPFKHNVALINAFASST